MQVTVSNKYQIVVPKEIRNKLSIKPGQKINNISVKGSKIIIDTEDKNNVVDKLLNKYIGSMPGAWGPDPVATIRKMRDEEWD